MSRRQRNDLLRALAIFSLYGAGPCDGDPHASSASSAAANRGDNLREKYSHKTTASCYITPQANRASREFA